MRKKKLKETNESPSIERIGTPRRKSSKVTILLIVLLLGAIGYIAYDKWQDYTQEKGLETYTAGAEYGYALRLSEIFNLGLNCDEPIKINNGSLEMNLIAVECLQLTPQ